MIATRLATLALLLLPAALAAADPPAAIDGLPLGGLRPQNLPKRGCGAYLFSTGRTKTLAAMALAEPASLRLALDGAVVDYPRERQGGVGGYGFAGETVYRGRDVTATLSMTIVERADLRLGATVPEATLRVDRPGKDSLVVPLAGLIGCAS